MRLRKSKGVFISIMGFGIAMITPIGSQVANADATQFTFSYTGAEQTWNVPQGVTEINIEALGASGGAGNWGGPVAPGGEGGYASGVLDVTPGEELYIFVGQEGWTQTSYALSSYAFGGGGPAKVSRGVGGGASDVRVGGDSLNDRVLVAGGGGGGFLVTASGAGNGGNGGGLQGQNGANYLGYITTGGSQTQAGSAYLNGSLISELEGSFGSGGGSTGVYTASGGGGGWYGGGAGTGGGGGSSYIGGVLNGVTTTGGNVGNGKIVITEVTPDTTPPTTSEQLSSNSTENNGWYVSPVQLTLSATDDGSVADTYFSTDGGETWQTYTSPVNFSTDGKYTVEYYSVDAAGNKETPKSVSFNVDKTPPTITGTATTSPNANGWYNSDVTVHFQASDDMSGIASVTPDVVLSTDGANQQVTGTATDNAGNSSSTTVTGINIDNTAPTATVTVDKPTLWPPNNKFVPVNVTVNAIDRGSGVASIQLQSITCNEDSNPADFVQGAQLGTNSTQFSLKATRDGNGTGRVYTIIYVITDKAGNSTTVSTTVKVPHDQGKN